MDDERRFVRTTWCQLMKGESSRAGRAMGVRLRVFAWLWGVALLLALSTLPVSASTNEPVELRLWNIPSKVDASPAAIARRRVFDAFCERYP